MEGTTGWHAAPVDWAAAEMVAARCGNRTRGLVAARNRDGLVDWLRWALENTAAPQPWATYAELAQLVAVTPGRGVGGGGWEEL